MILINRARNRTLHMGNDVVDEEAGKRNAEARGMLDQTEVLLAYRPSVLNSDSRFI